MAKIRRCLSRDWATIKRASRFWRHDKNPALDDQGRVIDWDHPEAPIFPNHCDIVIIGGGVVGSACAYFLKKAGKEDFRVVVVEKDPSVKTEITFVLDK